MDTTSAASVPPKSRRFDDRGGWSVSVSALRPLDTFMCPTQWSCDDFAKIETDERRVTACWHREND